MFTDQLSFFCIHDTWLDIVELIHGAPFYTLKSVLSGILMGHNSYAIIIFMEFIFRSGIVKGLIFDSSIQAVPGIRFGISQ